PSLAERKPFRLDEIILQTLDLMHYQLREYIVDYELEELTVYGEASALIQVFINLLSNSKDALPEEGGRIQLRCRACGVVELEDNGCGMSEEVRARLFEPFFTTKPVGEGTGLGWSVSYQILKEHSAVTEIESEPDRGTTIRIRFPVEKAE
ncbi:MAG: histidine kinase, partial [Candidatus Eremiobacteraeota bacterium]|nr:histidine kinase [Candidatus Eremiobacteraeota bacterium]